MPEVALAVALQPVLCLAQVVHGLIAGQLAEAKGVASYRRIGRQPADGVAVAFDGEGDPEEPLTPGSGLGFRLAGGENGHRSYLSYRFGPGGRGVISTACPT